MYFSSRIFLKHFLIDASLIFIGALFWFVFTMIVGSFGDAMGNSTTIMWVYFYLTIYALIMALFAIVLLWNLFQGVRYHQDVSKSKIGSSYRRFKKNPQPSQSHDLLTAILFGLDWMSLRRTNEYLGRISRGTVSVELEDLTWKFRDRLFRQTPKIKLVRNGEVITTLYIR